MDQIKASYLQIVITLFSQHPDEGIILMSGRINTLISLNISVSFMFFPLFSSFGCPCQSQNKSPISLSKIANTNLTDCKFTINEDWLHLRVRIYVFIVQTLKISTIPYKL